MKKQANQKKGGSAGTQSNVGQKTSKKRRKRSKSQSKVSLDQNHLAVNLTSHQGEFSGYQNIPGVYEYNHADLRPNYMTGNLDVFSRLGPCAPQNMHDFSLGENLVIYGNYFHFGQQYSYMMNQNYQVRF